MELVFDRDEMVNALQRIVGAADRRHTNPILANVRIRSLEDRIQLSTTDLELFWTVTVKGQATAAFDCTVSARKTLDIIHSAPREEVVRATIEDDKIIFRFGSARFNLSTLPAQDFPEWNTPDVIQWLHIPQPILRWQMEATMFAMAQQDVRFYLQGLLLATQGNLLRTVASDGHRLAMSETELEQGLDNDQECILPRKTVSELRKNLLDDSTPVKVGFARGEVLFVLSEDAQLASKIIEGRFPDYKRVIPDQHPYVLSVERETFRNALNRASIVANEKYKGVRMVLSPSSCVLSSNNAEQDAVEEAMPAEYSGNLCDIAFNLTYLLDVLSVIPTDRVRMELKDSSSSTLISSDPPGKARYVVMPIRL